MALIDSEAGEIVIRVVYDGPPEAGKTTSLRALAGSLAQPTYTPAEDAGGRARRSIGGADARVGRAEPTRRGGAERRDLATGGRPRHPVRAGPARAHAAQAAGR